MTKIKKILLIAGMVILTATTLSFLPDAAFAQIKEDIRRGACGAAGQAPCDSASATNSLNNTIANLINILSIIVGIIAVLMIIFAGFRYITSAGNDQTIASAKRTLIYAIIGLIIVALAQAIARFVLRNVTQ